jgi:hypothetical protein
LLALVAVALLGVCGQGQASAAENEVPTAGSDATTAAGSGDATSTVTNDEPAAAATPTAAAPTESTSPTGGPEQETSAESDAAVSNDAAVDQSSGQVQDGGSIDAAPAATDDELAHSGQEAHTAQEVRAEADASSSDSQNDAQSARVGTTGAGDRGAVEQASTAEATAGAAATQATEQQGAAAARSTDQQSASASASAGTSNSTNTLLDARVGAPGDDASFDQSVRAGAAARADLEGPDGAQQQSRAAANAEVADARNTAVELRLASDGDSAGGRQTIAADARAAAADATASAVIENPFNTFVSLRVNSDGNTGPVLQDVSARESETVNGLVTERLSEDAGDSTWSLDSNGVVIHFTSDGASTDLRIAVDDVTLHRPDEAPLFVWQWDMVFGRGSQPDCAITSSADAERVTWSFDCDPDDRVVRPPSAASAPAAPATNALSWIWNWLRPELSAWSWDRNDTFFLPACGPTCAVLLDFRWLSLEPTAAAVAPTEQTTAGTDAAAAVEQTNEVTSFATASADSTIEQTLIQSGGDQAALQQALVAQLVTAQAVAELTDAGNVSVVIGDRVTQVNRANAQVTAAVGAEIAQLLSQQQAGKGFVQSQEALQSASTTQQLTAGGIATVRAASNSDLSIGGSATQSATSSAKATGLELSRTRQVSEQEQQGDESDRAQLAGQWADTAQQLELLAGAGVSDVRISSKLNGHSATLRVGVGASSTGTSLSTIDQLTLQLQSGNEVAQQQESYQIAAVEQSGTALAAATAGGTLRYLLVPVTAFAQAAEPGALPGDTLLVEQAVIPATEASFVPVIAARPVPASPPTAAQWLRPSLTPLGPPTLVRLPAAARAAPLAVGFFNDSASAAGLTGPTLKEAGDAERASGGSPTASCLAPISGGSASSAGTGSGSAFVASSGSALIPVSRLGRRESSPAGRRPAAVVLLRAKPG